MKGTHRQLLHASDGNGGIGEKTDEGAVETLRAEGDPGSPDMPLEIPIVLQGPPDDDPLAFLEPKMSSVAKD